MIKKFLSALILFLSTTCVYAYQDCIITGDGKLTDINIEDNTVIDVYPLVTVMNEKKTLIVHPLKSGKTRFCVLKNNKNIVMFVVEADEFSTVINAPDGFEVFTLDDPTGDIEFTLDSPPEIDGGK